VKSVISRVTPIGFYGALQMWRKANPSVLLVCNNPGLPNVKNGENNIEIIGPEAQAKVNEMIEYEEHRMLRTSDVDYFFTIWENYFNYSSVHGFWTPPEDKNWV